ncbi:DUF2855 family protein [Hellea balneolensis]|uniref:DUF2855 family protein n=1 Tax=Hellea balneolensis TaxID=287478 RepID=UPI0003F59865|nr:DUF2855 family protein [Hellea balneolensis]
MTQTLLVNKSDFADVALVSAKEASLADGFIRVAVGPWALTSNNITYMAVGEQIGYWKFFDPKAYGIEMDDSKVSEWGRMPVWGYAKVTESNCEDIAAGTLIYGFLPITQNFDMKPVKLTPIGFQDGNDHRTELHPVYNGYTFVDKDPSFAAHRDLQPVLRPLFTTSFLIDDFLADENFFGAEQVLLLSASSKTAMGTAYCLKQRGGVKVIGLTSEGNKAFTEGTGFYDEVYTYDTITDMNPDVKTTVVDMAGNGKVMANVYDHFEENIVYNCMVGKSHWNGAPPRPPKLGAPPAMFFAPDRVKIRMKDWGGEGFAKNLAALWLPFCETAKDWLDITESHEVTELLKTYKDFLNGHASPAKGYLFKI